MSFSRTLSIPCFLLLALFSRAPHTRAGDLIGRIVEDADPKVAQLEQKDVDSDLIDVPVIPGERSPISSLPAVIRQPGSYYLTGDLVAQAFGGIVIHADDVTIDLNGFALVGSGVASSGILVDPSDARMNIRVHNGTVRDWGADGISLQAADLVVVEDVRSYQNGGCGIRAGVASRIRRCTLSRNGQAGVLVQAGSAVTESTATRNRYGFLGEGGAATFSGCTALQNDQSGFHAIAGAHLSACTSIQNGSYGIYSNASSVVSNCLVKDNGGIGIRAADASSVLGSSAIGNGAQGIVAFRDCRVSDSVAVLNSTGGIQMAAGGTTVADCTANRNGAYGILVGVDPDDLGCVVRGNTVVDNDAGDDPAYGILVNATRSRIDGNHLANNWLHLYMWTSTSTEGHNGHTRNIAVRNSLILDQEFTDSDVANLGRTVGQFFNFDRNRPGFPADLDAVGPWANLFSQEY